MKTDLKRLAGEMTAIVLVASLIGIAWNHRLLRDVFRGQGVPPPKATAPASPQTTTEAPAMVFPLGLMQVKELFDSREALIIDARDGETYRKGHIAGALSLPLGEAERLLPDFAARTPKERLIVVYCGGYDCHDSKTLGDSLLSAGYTQVFVFEGGFPEWRDAGYPVAQGGK